MNTEFSPHGHTFDPSLFVMLNGLAAARLEGKQHDKRRPPLALRVRNEGGDVLVLKPLLVSSPTGWKLTGSIDAELSVPVRVNELPAPARELRVALKEDGTIRPLRWWKDRERTRVAFETLLVMLGTLTADPEDLLRHSTHCCVCGRALTDAESRARGVGPECSKLFDFLHQFVRSKVDGVPLAEVVERAA